MKKDNQMKLNHLIIYVILFFIIWTVYRVRIDAHINNFSEFNQIISRMFIKIIVFILPVFIYLRYYENVNSLKYLKLKNNVKKGILGAMALSIFFFLYNIILVGVLGPGLKLNINIDPNYLVNSVILIGFTEEILFRGFLLQKLCNFITFRKAMIISSILFVLMHYPLWLANNMTFYSGILGKSFVTNSVYIFMFSILQTYIYKKTNSLWACIISHSFHNFIANIL